MTEYKGIRWDASLAQTQYFLDNYEAQDMNSDSWKLTLKGVQIKEALQGTDIRALMDGYISISRIRSAIYQ